MSVLCRVPGPQQRIGWSHIARIAILGFAVAGAGCASRGQSGSGPYAQVGGPPPAQIAQQRSIPVEIEDDGLPSQVPPPSGRRAITDDPSEPFSPNYGSRPASPLAAPRPPVRVSTVDEDALIARAIAAHEIRRQ
jgi:hypothetical protein